MRLPQHSALNEFSEVKDPEGTESDPLVFPASLRGQAVGFLFTAPLSGGLRVSVPCKVAEGAGRKGREGF